MNKIQLVVWAPRGLSIEGFARLVREDLLPKVLEKEPSKLKLTFTTEDPPRASIIPFERRGLALFSIWDEGDASLEEWSSCLGALGERVGGYRVSESLPCDYERDWSDGRQTPGIGLLTLLNRKPGLNDDLFLDRWHNGHTPLTLRTHPVWCYVRNVVEDTSAGSPRFDGIVEEHFRERSHLLNPALFFGGPLAGRASFGAGLLHMAPNMVRVAADISRFLDGSTLETYLVEERWVRG